MFCTRRPPSRRKSRVIRFVSTNRRHRRRRKRCTAPEPVFVAPPVPTGPPPPPPITLRFIGLIEAPQRSGRVALLSDGRGGSDERTGRRDHRGPLPRVARRHRLDRSRVLGWTGTADDSTFRTMMPSQTRVRALALLLCAVMLSAGCAASRIVRRGENAARASDWDTAVEHYRRAVPEARTTPTYKIALERAMFDRFAAAPRRRAHRRGAGQPGRGAPRISPGQRVRPAQPADRQQGHRA